MAILIASGVLAVMFFIFGKISEHKHLSAYTYPERLHWNFMSDTMFDLGIFAIVVFMMMGICSLCVNLGASSSIKDSQNEYDRICLEITTIGTEYQVRSTLDIIKDAESWNESRENYIKYAKNPCLRGFLFTERQAEWYEDKTIEIPVTVVN